MTLYETNASYSTLDGAAQKYINMLSMALRCDTDVFVFTTNITANQRAGKIKQKLNSVPVLVTSIRTMQLVSLLIRQSDILFSL